MSIFTKRKFRKGLLSVSVLLSVLSGDVYAQKASSNDVGIRRNERDSAPKSIVLPEGSNFRSADAQTIFSQYLEMDPATDKMVFGNTTNNAMGVTIDRYWQHYKGIKIDRAAYTVYAKDGKVKFLTGNFYKTGANLPSTPSLTETQAFNKALAFINADRYMWQDAPSEQAIKQMENDISATYFPKGKLVYIEKLTDGVWDGKLHLAYSFDIYAQKPLSRDIVYVDATNGDILHKNPQIKHTVTTANSLYSGNIPIISGFVGGNYVLHDSTRGDGIFTYDCNSTTSYANNNFINSLLSWTTPDAGIDAHWGAEQVYDYWWNVHGRNSFNNAGAAIRSYVHYDVSYNNAFWDGSRMTYGDGTGIGNGGFDPLTSIDVVSHEIGHAICTYTSDLDYTGQSGGMNEGFSDIWGAVVESWSDPNESDAMAKQTWTIGEEITNAGFGLRSMNNPASHNDPDTYLGTNWVSTTQACNGGNDYCGVHTNSGVLNKWFYILTVGETGTNDIGSNYSVTGVGMTIAALIAYQTEQALVNNSDYADARAASISISGTLYGPCSAITEAVTNAWYAVGVGSAFVSCFPTIGFSSATNSTTEWNNTTVCPSTKTINLPVTVTTAPTGGNATVTITSLGGTAVLGTDYTIGGPLTFPAGSTTTQNAVITIYDNGAINDSKYVTLQLNLTSNGSNAQLSNVTDTTRLTITNQDNAPTGGSTNVLNLLANNTTSNASSPFQSSFRKVRMQHLYLASELTAAGIVPGVPISALAMNVVTKNSTQAYTGFTVSMAHTTATNITGFIVGTYTQVYSANYSTVLGWNTLPFSTNFVWDGTSNLVVNFCFNNTSNIGSNDVIQGDLTAFTVFAKSNGTTAGCSLTTTTGTSSARPIMRLTQVVPPTVIETTNASSRIWNVRSNTEVYFYSSADSQAIAGIRNMNNELGCTNGSLTGGGNGFVATTYGGTVRSRKEFTIAPTTNGSTTTYNATVYMTAAELAGTLPNTLFLVKTNEPTDATINQSNSTIISPTLVTNANFTAFSANFTGFGRYYLTDGPLPPPIPVITPASTTTFCQGGSVQLNGNTGTSVTYSWLRNGTLIPGATTSSYNATLSGTYLYIMTNSVNVSDTSAPVTVTVNPAPTATATPAGPTSVCNGSSVTMNANTGTGLSYQWQINTVNLPGATTSTFVASTTGFYTVVVTNSNGCSATSSPVSVVVNANPVASASANTPVCIGSTLFLTSTAVPGSSYAWSGPNSFSSTLQNVNIVNMQNVNAGDYYLTVTNTTTGCMGMDTVNVSTQNGAPPAQPGSITGLTPVCSGTTNNYSVAPVTGASSYTWTLPNGWTGTSFADNINAIAGTTPGNITVTANNACGSSTPATYNVAVNPAPNTPTVIGSIVYCLNEPPAVLTATGNNLLWYSVPTGGIGDVNAPTPTTNIVGITPFYVSQSDGICESDRSIILVTVNTLPSVVVTQVGNTFTASGAYPFYQWYLNGVLIIGATNQVYTATQDGDYTVLVQDINSCTFLSDPITIASTGVQSVVSGDPKFYPNPTTGLCWLELPNTQSSTEVLITDVTGKVIDRVIVKDQRKIQFDLSKVARGVYVVKVITTDKTYTSRITLQ
jgi:Zn-dependent metalloprotease